MSETPELRPRVYIAAGHPSEDAIRELSEFLRSQLVRDEKELQRLLERHPELVGLLDFSHFVSELPI